MAFQSNQGPGDPQLPANKQRTLMESLLAKKIDMASGAHAVDRRLFRTDSVDSTSSMGSLILGDDVCRCDDCLLGIADLYTIGPAESALARKKVKFAATALHRRCIVLSSDASLYCCFNFSTEELDAQVLTVFCYVLNRFWSI